MRLYRLLLIALATALLACLPARAAEPPTYTPLGPGDIYLALGDSLSVGVEAAANNDSLPGYPAYFYDIIKATGPISYTNLGVSGETAVSMLTPGGQLDDAVAYITAQIAAGKTVSPVTLDIGGNDMVAVLLPTSTTNLTDALTLYRSNLETILDQLLAALTVNGQRTGDLLLMNYYNPYPGLKQSLYGSQIKADPDVALPLFNQLIAEEAAERGLPVYDAFSAFTNREPELIFVKYPYVFTNIPSELEIYLDYHPRAAGHRVLARGFAEISGYQLPRLYAPVVFR
jgi:lysophospholipase L1-like esterase